MKESPVLNKIFELPNLPYAFDALEPVIDKMTMQIHHDKHHGGYVSKLNVALERLEEAPLKLEEILQDVSEYSESIRNNAGGHFNHSMFWKLMKPNGGGKPTGELLEMINTSFGSFDRFKDQFTEAATTLFGSGWVWLVVQNKKLKIGTTANQDNPLMDVSSFKGMPVLCLDVWEHAYYLKYKNKRVDYITAWWSIVNWEQALKNFQATFSSNIVI